MVRSMTGYGAGEARADGIVVKVELRSVNHRFFDPSIRISRDPGGLEGRVKELLAERISRGRVSATVEVALEGEEAGLSLDEGLADAYRRILETLRERYRLEGASDPLTFAQLPDVVRRQAPVMAAERIESVLAAAVGTALGELTAMRAREGEALGRELRGRVGRLDSVLDRIEAAASGSAERVKEKLRERIAQLVPEGAAPDADRLATEVAILSDKADIREEIVRFRAHDAAFLAFLERGDAVGKRLDFLLQEMNREANTIGSKSVSAEVTHLVVEAKEEIERLREQVQNVE
ncbi:MAG: YicC/YloC family endoribonuclease [Candidatus Eiseniibacteriota bacterium]